MAWWNKLFRRLHGTLEGRKYRTLTALYNLDASRSATLLDFGFTLGTYIKEQERRADGQYVDRFGGALVGPFRSPDLAERFIVRTDWFSGRDSA